MFSWMGDLIYRLVRKVGFSFGKKVAGEQKVAGEIRKVAGERC